MGDRRLFSRKSRWLAQGKGMQVLLAKKEISETSLYL